MFQAKNADALSQQNLVQMMVVRASDINLQQVQGGDVIITIGEPLVQVISAQVHDNSVPSLTSLTAAALIICDSTAFTAGGDRKSVRLDGIASMDANDHVILQYITVK